MANSHKSANKSYIKVHFDIFADNIRGEANEKKNAMDKKRIVVTANEPQSTVALVTIDSFSAEN